MPLGVSWDVSWEPLGGLLGRLGGLLAVPGASWSVLGASGEPLGASWGPLGGILGASWRPLGASWALPGAILEDIVFSFLFLYTKREMLLFSLGPSEPPNGPLEAILRRYWGALGRYWGPLRPLLVLSWGVSWEILDPS